MSVTLTDEKHAELVRMLDTIVRGCDARAYDIGLSLDPLRDLLGEVATLTREPAPAAPLSGGRAGLLAQAAALLKEGEFGALEDHAESVCRRINEALDAPAPDPGEQLVDAINEPPIGKRNVVATHRVAAPAPCPHREALENLNDAYCSAACSDDGAHKIQCSDARAALKQPCAAPTSARCLGCEDRPFGALWSPNARPHTCEKAQPCAAPCSCRQQLMAVIDSVKESVTASILASGIVPYRTASAIEQLLDTAQKERCECGKRQSCAAPGEAGEWSEAGLVTHKFKAHYDVAGSCTEPLSNIAQDGDYIRVYEPRYRRRAPEREGGAR